MSDDRIVEERDSWERRWVSMEIERGIIDKGER